MSVGNITLQHPPDSPLNKGNMIIFCLLSEEKKVYVHRRGNRRLSKHRPFVSCHSRRQISENQVNRLKSYIQAVAGQELSKQDETSSADEKSV